MPLSPFSPFSAFTSGFGSPLLKLILYNAIKYTPNWTEEVFLIDEIRPTDPITYKITDLNGEEIKGTFHGEDLKKTDQTIFRIEKVIRKTKDNAFVKWKGYPDQFIIIYNIAIC